jgi:quercetin dioxygenase-like cupin family protein
MYRTSHTLLITTALIVASVPSGGVQAPVSHSQSSQSIPLVLQVTDGESRLRRPPPASLSTLAAPFLIKVDPTPGNGGAQDFVVFTEDVPVGASISPHRHPHSEEVLYIHAGRGTAWLDGRQAVLQPGTIIYMPRNTGVKLTNDGTEPMAVVAIFSRPGFDSYQRDISVPAGEVAKPLTEEELNAIRARHREAVVYDLK